MPLQHNSQRDTRLSQFILGDLEDASSAIHSALATEENIIRRVTMGRVLATLEELRRQVKAEALAEIRTQSS